MTHEYTLLVNGIVLPAADGTARSAVAWAEGTILAVGTDAQIRAISRGDSALHDLAGAFVVPLGVEDSVAWPPAGSLEIGSPADIAILSHDPRFSPITPGEVTAFVRGGRVVRGSLPS